MVPGEIAPVVDEIIAGGRRRVIDIVAAEGNVAGVPAAAGFTWADRLMLAYELRPGRMESFRMRSRG